MKSESELTIDQLYRRILYLAHRERCNAYSRYYYRKNRFKWKQYEANKKLKEQQSKQL